MSTEGGGPESRTVEVPEGVSVSYSRGVLRAEGPRGRALKSFRKIPVGVSVGGGSVVLRAAGTRKRDYAILNTARSLVRNLCEGVRDGYTVRMKVVYAHFPITVKAEPGRVLIENFQGERAARTARIVGATEVAVSGEDVTLTGPVLTDVTQTAANIVQNTKVKGKDHRVFLDGIYVQEKRRGA